MLVGAPPFARADGDARARAMPPMPAHERRPGLSPGLSRAIQRALAPEPDDRWSSLREFRRAIERALSEPEPQPELPSPPAAAPPAWAPAPAPVLAAELATREISTEAAQRTERVQAKKVGRALSTIIIRRIQENRLQLPSMPLVALKTLDVLRDPDATFATIAKVLEQDPVIAARVLRVVNSAAYSRRQAVTTLEQAVSQIGVKPLRILLVEFAACQIFTSRSAGIRQKFKLIWEHCLAVGMLSRDLARHLSSRVDPDVAYLGGLLHDVGKPIVAGLLLEAERKLVEELDVPFMTETLWQKTVAECHRGIGAAVAAGWKIPSAVVEAIENCDTYDRAMGAHSCANLVRFANVLTKREGIYVGDVSGDEIVAAVLQGRQVLGIVESVESSLIATLRDRTGSVVGDPSHRVHAHEERARRSRRA
jgi:putative nucleotidyltransferase with HDIG domain